MQISHTFKNAMKTQSAVLPLSGPVNMMSASQTTVESIALIKKIRLVTFLACADGEEARQHAERSADRRQNLWRKPRCTEKRIQAVGDCNAETSAKHTQQNPAADPPAGIAEHRAE